MIRHLFRVTFRVFFWIAATLGCLLMLVGFIAYLGTKPSSKPLRQDTILTLRLNGPYVEHTEGDSLQALILGKDASLYNLTRSILYAARDPKVKGLLVRLESPSLGIAQIQELRDALLIFQASGKPSWCYVDSFGDMSPGTGLYYLATACQEIWLQPLGSVNLTGLAFEVPFGKSALEKLDVKPEFAYRKEYKSFVEMFTRNEFSEENREALQAIADSILSQIVEGIAHERKVSHEKVRTLIENGPYLTEAALTEKLVDRLDYRQNLIKHIQKKFGKSISFVKVKTYLEALPLGEKGGKIALIFGSGIIRGDGGDHSPLNERTITSNAMYGAFEHIFEDKDVKAIVFRINSEGGSPVASEAIYSLIQEAKERGIPVIVSMSDAAASGGYWISAAGTKIVAHPGTLTGSIGVFAGKFVLTGLLDKLGITLGEISTNDNARMWSINESFTPTQWLKMNEAMDHIYSNFVGRVEKARQMTPDQVEKVAKGRVWTGEQALALGLVDQMGGLSTAIELARKEAKLPEQAKVQIFPREKSLLEILTTLVDEDDDALSQTSVLAFLITPFKKMHAFVNVFCALQQGLYTPLRELH